jgi:PAS domain S-box-containing protein
MPLNLLLLEDSVNDALVLKLFLKRSLEGCEITVVNTLEEFEMSLKHGFFDAIISDYQLGTYTGMDAFQRLQVSGSDLPFILISGTLGDELAVGALKSGVSDFVAKSNLSRLPSAIEREVATARMRRQKMAADHILQVNEHNLKALIENTDDCIWSINRNMQITILNHASKSSFQAMYGVDLHTGMYFPDSLPSSVISNWDQLVNSAFTGQKSRHELPFSFADGNKRIVEVSVNPILDADHEISGVSFFAKDITQRKMWEEQLGANLREKEILLAEIHHRVKNNLAIVSSILMLQQDKIEDGPHKQVYTEAIHKIKSIALIHEKLYQNNSLAEIEFSEYIQSLADSVSSSMRADKPIRVDVDAEPKIFDIISAIPCGLILSELLTNAYKHAFRDQADGRILIEFRNTGTGFRLRVMDDGVRTDVLEHMEKSASVGMLIVRGLAEQLGATLSFESDRGTIVTLEK